MEAPTPHRAPSDLPESLTRDLDRDELSRLVRAENDRGTSFQAMSDRAAEAGESLSKAQFQKLATGSVKSAPDVGQLRAIAAGIRKPLPVVQRAAAVQWLDYRATELSGYDDEVRIIVAHLAGMPPTEQRRWRLMMEASEQASEESP